MILQKVNEPLIVLELHESHTLLSQLILIHSRTVKALPILAHFEHLRGQVRQSLSQT